MAHRYRMYPTEREEAGMQQHCNDARAIYNLALEQRNMWCRGRQSAPNYVEQNRQLTELRSAFPATFGAGSSSVQQGALRDLDRSFSNFFRGSHGYPSFRSAKQGNQGFVVQYLSVRKINRKWAEILVPKVGKVRFRLSRPIPSEAKSARVTLDRSGRWHVSFQCPQTPFRRSPTGQSVGIDMGIAQSVTLSTGEQYDIPVLMSPGELQRKKRLQRRLARQIRGSNRRERTRKSLARISAKESDRRKDWIEQTTTRLVSDYDHITIEDLNVKAMSSGSHKRGLNREIRNQAWGLFRSRLESKALAATEPCSVVAIHPAYTSQRCHKCGHTARNNRETQAKFSCKACGHTDSADVNAARNIHAVGCTVTGRGGISQQRPVEAPSTRTAHKVSLS
jgi:putative transposase